MYAKRNRELKALLEKAFGKGKVYVRGSRGTATGWVSVYIDVECSSALWPKLREKVWELMKTAKIEIDTYGYDDPGSDYGYGSKIHINFHKPWDVTRKEKLSNA